MRNLTALAIALSLAGCAPKYGCKGLPEDPACLSAVDAYKATDKTNTTLRLPEATATNPETGETPTTANALVEPAPVPKIDDPTPIRSPSKVMRIWVAPWEDAEGDLNVSGFVFTELEPRRWMIGRSAPTITPTIAPLQVMQREKEKKPVRSENDDETRNTMPFRSSEER